MPPLQTSYITFFQVFISMGASIQGHRFKPSRLNREGMARLKLEAGFRPLTLLVPFCITSTEFSSQGAPILECGGASATRLPHSKPMPDMQEKPWGYLTLQQRNVLPAFAVKSVFAFTPCPAPASWS